MDFMECTTTNSHYLISDLPVGFLCVRFN